MKLKLVVVDFEIPSRVKKWGLRLGIPAAVLLGGGAVAYAGGLVTFSTGQTLQASALDANFQYLAGQIMAPVNANLGTLVGTNPMNPSTTPTIWQAATFTGTFNATGDMTIPFPSPFPNGVVTVTATNGDYAAYQGGVAVDESGNPVTKAQFLVHGAPNNTARVNYIAIGF